MTMVGREEERSEKGGGERVRSRARMVKKRVEKRMRKCK